MVGGKHFRHLNSVSLTDDDLSYQDVIFKNQAMNQKTPGQGNFVNDLLRTEFHRFVDTFSMYSQELTDKPHRKFMAKFIKVCSLYFLTFLRS
jgi:Cwf15/Cwc15 cell cycle control protein